MCPMKTNQSAHQHSLISLHCLHEETASLAIQNALSEDSDQTVRMRADLNLCWVCMFESTFSDVVTHMQQKKRAQNLIAKTYAGNMKNETRKKEVSLQDKFYFVDSTNLFIYKEFRHNTICWTP